MKVKLAFFAVLVIFLVLAIDSSLTAVDTRDIDQVLKKTVLDPRDFERSWSERGTSLKFTSAVQLSSAERANKASTPSIFPSQLTSIFRRVLRRPKT